MKVLFVCSGNSYRSPVAEALLKKIKPTIDVDSAGTNPSIPISEAAKRYLVRENALEYLKSSPESLDSKKLHGFDLIVAMEQIHKEAILKKCPECEAKIVVWNIEDPYFLPYGSSEPIFSTIKAKVKQLVDTLPPE